MLVSLILVTTKHVFAHMEKTAPNVTSHVCGIVSIINVAENVQRNVIDLHAMSFVTRNCVVVTGVLDSVERDA